MGESSQKVQTWWGGERTEEDVEKSSYICYMCAKNSQSKNYTNFCQMFPKAQDNSAKYFLLTKCT